MYFFFFNFLLKLRYKILFDKPSFSKLKFLESKVSRSFNEFIFTTTFLHLCFNTSFALVFFLSECVSFHYSLHIFYISGVSHLPTRSVEGSISRYGSQCVCEKNIKCHLLYFQTDRNLLVGLYKSVCFTYCKI